VSEEDAGHTIREGKEFLAAARKYLERRWHQKPCGNHVGSRRQDTLFETRKLLQTGRYGRVRGGHTIAAIFVKCLQNGV